jgi:DNA-binding XRE family transcriptional regulator
MNSHNLMTAQLSIPVENLEVIAVLVAKLGGELIVDDEVVTVPPLPEEERIGRMLRGLRLRAEMTQKELAMAINVPQSHVSEYEKNKRAIPRGKATELAKILKTVPSNFLPRD